MAGCWIVRVPRGVQCITIIVFGIFLLLVSLPQNCDAASLREGNNFVFDNCYAHLSGIVLTLGNAHIRRSWRIDDGKLYPISYYDQDEHVEWITRTPALPAPTPPMPTTAGSISLRGASGVFGPTQASSLRIEMEVVKDRAAVDYEFQIFPNASGIRMWLVIHGSASSAPSREPSDRQVTQPIDDALEHLQIPQAHLRFTQVVLHSQTDRHNELAMENEWLLHPNEGRLILKGNLFFLENTLTGNGIAFLKEAPLPDERPIEPICDAWVSAEHMLAPTNHTTPSQMHFDVSFYGNGIKQDGAGDAWALLAYHGGRNGRIAALHEYQRQIRRYVPGRDGQLISNTWGDRSEGKNLDEEFVRKEIDAGKALGVDIVEVDAGWQLGKLTEASNDDGIREGYWKSNPDFWKDDPVRFPHGFAGLSAYAHADGMKLGLWYSPDSADDFSAWQRDASTLIQKRSQEGIDAFKLDMFTIRSRHGEENVRSLIGRVLNASHGKMLLDSDITAESRLGYFGDIAAGPLFVENRYTDSHRYWPHQTLRNFWKLSQYVDPVRLRMEFLNSERNTTLYAGDPLAPERYSPATLFAITMFGSPLGWFENSHLSSGYIAAAAPVIAEWKQERESIQEGTILPIGDAPDGVSWTGFASIAKDRRGGYLLLFRELNQASVWMVPGGLFASAHYQIKTLAGQGKVLQEGNNFRVQIPAKRGFVWVSLKPALR